MAQVFKATADPFVGRLTYFRVVSGTLNGQGHVYNANRREDERVGNLLVGPGQGPGTTCAQVGPGDIAAVAKLTSTAAGDTLVADRSHAVQLRAARLPRAVAAGGDRAGVEGRPRQARPGAPSARRGGARACMIRREDGTGETILTAMGDAHVDVIVDRLKRKFGAAVQTGDPARPVPRDDPAGRRASTTSSSARPAATASTATWSSSSSRPRWAPGFQFGDKIVGGVVPKQYIPAVEKGLREAMAEGVLAGYPVVDLAGDAGRRLVPHGRLLRDGVQGRGLTGAEEGLRRGVDPRSSSRSSRSTSSFPTSTWAT